MQPGAIPTPLMSIPEAHARLTAPGGRFEVREIPIRGVPTRTWLNGPQTLRDVLDLGRTFGDREFLVHEDDRVTYAAFGRAVDAFARRLQAEGVLKGDRVAIVMRNLPEWAVAFYGCVLAGAIATPLNAWWTGAELEFGLQDSGSKVAVFDEERLGRILPRLDACPALQRIFVARAQTPPADPRIVALESVLGAPNAWGALPDGAPAEVALEADDDVAIMYTSGTTGQPKGALATHRNIVGNIMSVAFSGVRNLVRFGLPMPTETDPHKLPQRVNLLTVPLFHATGLTSKVVLMRRWDVEKALRLIEEERINAVGGVPTIAWQVTEAAEHSSRDLSSINVLSYGGAPAAPELVRRITEVFPKVTLASGWGMTETMASFTTITGLEYELHPDSTGPAVPVSDMQVRDVEDGATVLPIGAVGELWVRGPQLVRLYWNRPEATAETFVDGWLRTGDLARIDDEGFLYIVDRAKDMLIRGGENIYCLEVENVLYEHPDVVDAALVGLPHRTLGEEPAAVVYLRPGGAVSAEALRDLVRAKLASFKVPVKVMFWPEPLPRNANGKILKRELRTAMEAAASPKGEVA
jgi:long-chain acyl-CoA synthetase